MTDALPGDIFQRGQVLNHTYEIEGVLGRGGTGEVYRARNLISGRVVAIKALNAQFSGNDAYIDLMKREEQMRDILHDAVVRYTECSRSDEGHVFLVMDFIDGPSMNDLMLSRRMEPRELMVIAHRVAEGLVAAHKRGIVHRDLSPDNVVLRDGNPERATIIDFGIAKDTAAGARTIVGNDFAGKYEYAAPEQLEGRAEPRSDLYALGALLLAGFRGQIPFAGATPGEMIRRKQGPLDTVGVPEPLKGLVEWLAAPRLADRAPSAAAVVARLDMLLKPPGRETKVAGDGRRRPLVAVLFVVVLIAVLGAGAWMGGLLDGIFPEPVPHASPYAFAARSASPAGPASLTGNAPGTEAAERLVAAFNAAAGGSAPLESLTIATGQPAETWPTAVTTLLDGVRGLEEWSVALADRTARVEGIAPDRAARERTAAALDAWAAEHGFTLSAALMTGPRNLPSERVAEALAEVADCGALGPDRPAGDSYGLGDTIRVTGNVGQPATATLIEAAVAAIAGDRQVSLDTQTLNVDLCAVRRVLPDVPSAALSIWLGDGETGQANPAGIFRTGQNPVVEIHAPADLSDGSLWVAVVDNTGKVFNILPNINDEEHDLADIGTVENGVRRIRVLHSLAEQRADARRLAVTVNDGDYGKSEIVAILSKADLFGVRRPRDESIASFAEALAEIQEKQPGNIVGLASRLLDSRP